MAFTSWAFPSLLALALGTAVGAYVLLRNPRGPANRAFAIWMAFYAVWNIGKIGMRSSEDPANALLWAKFAYLGLLFIAPAFAHFAFRLVERKFNAAYLYFPFAALLAILPTGLFISGVHYQAWGYHFYYGALFPLFGLAFFPLVAYASALLWNARNAVKKPLVRERLELVIYPAIAALSYLGASEILLPMLGIYSYPLSGLLTALLALSTAYAFLLKK